MHILKGDYPLKKRRLHLIVHQDFDFGDAPTCLFLTGANGLGKTSFIEKVLIPSLKSQGIPFLYLGQDIRTQLYTLKAALAVSTKDKVPIGMAAVLSRWLDNNRQARVFILDEFDKYTDQTELLFKISREFMHTYVIVSHANHPIQPGPPFKTHRLYFREITSVDECLRVEIVEASPWS